MIGCGGDQWERSRLVWRRELGDRRDNINQKLQYYPEEAFNYNSPGDHKGANTHLLTVVCPGPDRIFSVWDWTSFTVCLQLADYKPQTNLQITSLPARDSPSWSNLRSDQSNISQLRLENVEDGGGKAGAPHSSGQIQWSLINDHRWWRKERYVFSRLKSSLSLSVTESF